MRSLRALILVLIAALTFGGALSAAAPAFAAPVACHESSHQPAAPEKQKPAQVAVNCCAGCLPAPSQVASALVAPALPLQEHARPTAERLESLARAPEPHPPRYV